jgi:hypothetical protein
VWIAFLGFMLFYVEGASAQTPDVSEDCQETYDGLVGIKYEYGEFFDFVVDGSTITFIEPKIFCVKAGESNSGVITGTSFTVNWYVGKNQIPDISHFVIYENPTAVDLLYFTSQINKNRTTLRWETASEFNIIQFNIYRSRIHNEIKRKLFTASATAPGELNGNFYQFTDRKRNRTTPYWLEIVYTNGNSEWVKAEKLPLDKK